MRGTYKGLWGRTIEMDEEMSKRRYTEVLDMLFPEIPALKQLKEFPDGMQMAEIKRKDGLIEMDKNEDGAYVMKNSERSK